MARKRRFEQLQAAAAAPPETKIYVNPLQKQVDEKLDEVGKKFEGKGRTILYGIGAILLIALLVFLFMRWSRSSDAAGQFALGKAIDTSKAQISETGPAPGTTAKTFSTEKARSEAAIAEFQTVADKFGGSIAEKAKYFIAVNKLSLDRAAGIAELEGLSTASSNVGFLSKFALAQTRVGDNKLDEAANIYKDLLTLEGPIAKDTINFELAGIYVKQDKKQEAADIYFNIAKAASEAKDLDGKPVRMTETASESKKKLKELDPTRAAQIVDPAVESPFGSTAQPFEIQ